MTLRFSLQASAVAAMLVVASVASATPIGTLAIANVTNGGVTVTANSIDWLPPVGPAVDGFGNFNNGSTTDLTYDGGVVNATTNPFGQILDLTFSPGLSLPDFIRFYTDAPNLPSPPGTPGTILPGLSFDLVSVSDGGSAQGALDNCAGVTAIGVQCSPLIGGTVVSPFVLVRRPGNLTDISLSLELLGRDSSGSTAWSGGFTTQIPNLTPSQIQDIINLPGGSVSSTYSGTFVSTVIPEPGTYMLLGSGLLLAGFARRRLNRS